MRLHAFYFSMIESGQETALASQTVIIRTYTELTKMERERGRGGGVGLGEGGRWQNREERRRGRECVRGLGRCECVCGGVGPA